MSVCVCVCLGAVLVCFVVVCLCLKLRTFLFPILQMQQVQDMLDMVAVYDPFGFRAFDGGRLLRRVRVLDNKQLTEAMQINTSDQH